MKKSEQCTKGLNRTIVLFETSLCEIMQSDEIDKLIKHTRWKEREYLKMLKKLITEDGFSCVNIWAYLPVLQKTPHLLADIIAYMVTKDNLVVEGEELDAMFNNMHLQEKDAQKEVRYE